MPYIRNYSRAVLSDRDAAFFGNTFSFSRCPFCRFRFFPRAMCALQLPRRRRRTGRASKGTSTFPRRFFTVTTCKGSPLVHLPRISLTRTWPFSPLPSRSEIICCSSCATATLTEEDCDRRENGRIEMRKFSKTRTLPEAYLMRLAGEKAALPGNYEGGNGGGKRKARNPPSSLGGIAIMPRPRLFAVLFPGFVENFYRTTATL